jgi:hypothetical protein
MAKFYGYKAKALHYYFLGLRAPLLLCSAYLASSQLAPPLHLREGSNSKVAQ